MSAQASPVVSIIIPTAGRPRYLPRSVESALDSSPAGSSEVIVVPNGADRSWNDSLARFACDARLRIEPVATAHANVARNHGLGLARGVFVRFLDDDDYLYPSAAVRQCEDLLSSGAEISSGTVDAVEENGRLIRVLSQPATSDLVVATLAPSRTTLPTAHLFRRVAIRGLKWDEALPVRQDTDWMMRVCRMREFCWQRFDEPVGVWVHHSGGRISRSHQSAYPARVTAEMVIELAQALSREGRLTEARGETASDALWSLLQKGLMHDPGYWHEVAKTARGLAKARHPPSRIYSFPFVRDCDPLLVESMLVPFRRMRLWLTGKS